MALRVPPERFQLANTYQAKYVGTYRQDHNFYPMFLTWYDSDTHEYHSVDVEEDPAHPIIRLLMPD